jgi:hypothetical protein
MGHLRLSGVAGATALTAALVACGQVPLGARDALSQACQDARSQLAAAPEPVNADAEAAFIATSQEAAGTVASVADDVASRGDDPTIADLAWQLHRLSSAGAADEMLIAAHEAQAGIMRIDGFAQTLEVRACGAAMWRPAAWRAVADRHSQRPDDATFRRRLDQLCAETFPEPSLLASGMPLLSALVADAPQSGDVKARVIARLNTVNTRTSDAARFISGFSDGLARLEPSTTLEGEYLALLAAFMRLDSAVPSAMPKHPPPAVRERVDAALDDLQRAWDALDLTC